MNPEERREFGAYIRRLREAKGLSLRDVEREVKISNSYLYQIERGDRNPPKPEVLRRLAALFGVPFNAIMAAAGLQAQEEVNLFHSQIERAFEYVRRDPRFRYGMQATGEELSIGTKRFIVELYQQAHPELKLIDERLSDEVEEEEEDE